MCLCNNLHRFLCTFYASVPATMVFFETRAVQYSASQSTVADHYRCKIKMTASVPFSERFLINTLDVIAIVTKMMRIRRKCFLPLSYRSNAHYSGLRSLHYFVVSFFLSVVTLARFFTRVICYFVSNNSPTANLPVRLFIRASNALTCNVQTISKVTYVSSFLFFFFFWQIYMTSF